ncbi:MAG TPA: SGNH/GDSL hydrolase family protein [Vineibacter sp.]|nr:SGNH/GDSL hydrolase family protein [Vineibacter sp.]
MVRDSKSSRAANTALAAASLLVALILPELAYRVYLVLNDPLAAERWRWWITTAVDGDFDAGLGQRLAPESRIHASVVRNGVVAGCLGEVYRTNVDGLGGATTLADYAGADLRIVLTGDSFGRWRLGGLTIADVLQQRLADATGQRVAVLNFARGGYGLLQMISIAAVQAESAKPALIVVAFITDDLTRGRWWSKAVVIDGRLRELLAARPEDVENPDRASDTSIIDPRATAGWCEERHRRGDRDAVLHEANAFVEAEIKRRNLRPALFAADRTYFYAMLWRRLHGVSTSSAMPRISTGAFAGDARYRADRERLRSLGVPVIFVHLPVQPELAAGRPLSSGAAAEIWRTIERDFATKVVTYFDLERRPVVPSVYNLEPLDSHPNADGIKFYGDVAFSAIEQRSEQQSRRR